MSPERKERSETKQERMVEFAFKYLAPAAFIVIALIKIAEDG